MSDFHLDEKLAAQIAHVETFLPRPAKYSQPTKRMHPQLKSRLEATGIPQLYTHQAQSYDAVMAGRDVVVVTGTNSGKTLCYNLPALQMAMTEPACRVLFLFPTKALAQDQLGRLQLLAGPETRIGTYDGDTAQSQRGPTRKLAHLVLSNPDMLHIGILPNHEQWAKFFKSLRLIVIDEMHVYRGVFGSHVGNVLRRLLRLCEWHHSRPQIVGCSATIANPRELFESLTGRKPVVVDEDGAPHGQRTLVFWNPPTVGENARLSANVATSEILASLAESGKRTLAFSRARVSAELVLRYTRKRLEAGGVIKPESIESYRSGYTPKERRQIEQALFKGKLMGLSSTNALELGVDVGALDAVVLNGYPGTTSSFWQRAGRAGRGTKDGVTIFVAHDDPLEQFLIREPRMLLDARIEHAAANPSNPTVLEQHLICAVHEKPMAPSELDRFGVGAMHLAESLDRKGTLEFRGGLFFYPSMEPPALKVNLRNGGGDQVRLYADGEEIGQMERWRAMNYAHEGAVYLHRGATFLVTELDLENLRASVVSSEVNFYTQSILQATIDSNGEIQTQELGKARVHIANLKVTDRVVGFRRKSLDGDTILSTEPLELPPCQYDTVGLRIDLPQVDYEQYGAAQIAGLHGFEHALMAVAPLLAGCDRQDLGSAWYTMYFETLRPALFVFDKAPGGVGLSDALFKSFTGWLRAAEGLLTSCDCEMGCPACLMSAQCESNNESLDKGETLRLIRQLL